jgi:hypothetical protein
MKSFVVDSVLRRSKDLFDRVKRFNVERKKFVEEFFDGIDGIGN